MDLKKYEVPVEKLRWECDPNLFNFECTEDLAPLREFIGQERAIAGRRVRPEHGQRRLQHLRRRPHRHRQDLHGQGLYRKVIKERGGRRGDPRARGLVLPLQLQGAGPPADRQPPAGQGQGSKKSLTSCSPSQAGARPGLLQRGVQEPAAEDRRGRAGRAAAALRGDRRRGPPAGLRAPDDTRRARCSIPLIDDHPMQETEYLALEEQKRKELEAKQAELRKKLQAKLRDGQQRPEGDWPNSSRRRTRTSASTPSPASSTRCSKSTRHCPRWSSTSTTSRAIPWTTSSSSRGPKSRSTPSSACPQPGHGRPEPVPPLPGQRLRGQQRSQGAAGDHREQPQLRQHVRQDRAAVPLRRLPQRPHHAQAGGAQPGQRRLSAAQRQRRADSTRASGRP